MPEKEEAEITIQKQLKEYENQNEALEKILEIINPDKTTENDE